MAFNFHFLLAPKLNWVLVSALAMGGVLQKAEAGIREQPGRGAQAEREPLFVTILLLGQFSCWEYGVTGSASGLGGLQIGDLLQS